MCNYLPLRFPGIILSIFIPIFVLISNSIIDMVTVLGGENPRELGRSDSFICFQGFALSRIGSHLQAGFQLEAQQEGHRTVSGQESNRTAAMADGGRSIRFQTGERLPVPLPSSVVCYRITNNYKA